MSPQTNKPKRYGRRLFIAATFIAAAYLLLVFRSCMRDAQMSLGGSTMQADTTLASLVINQKPYVPPKDSLLTIAQIQFELDVLQAIDFVDKSSNSPAERAASIFNRHVKSLSEYTWIRMMTLRALQASARSREWNEVNTGSVQKSALKKILDTVSTPTMSDTVVAANRKRLRMFLPTFFTRAGVLSTSLE